MLLSGQVVQENRKRGYTIVAVEGGDFAVFEVMDRTELKPGCQVRGNLHATGFVTLLDLASGKRFSAYGHTGPSTLEDCNKVSR